MQESLTQARHNEEFHSCICTQFDERFYDWKITTVFYTALHYLKALADKKGISIGDTHSDVESSVNPERDCNKMAITKTAWKNYKNLYKYSRTARYDGITDFETFEELKKEDYAHCLVLLRNFKLYINSKGVEVTDV